MTWNASSSPCRKSARSWSSDRSRRSGTETRWRPAGTWTLAASKCAPADCNRSRGQKFRFGQQRPAVDVGGDIGDRLKSVPNVAQSLAQGGHHVLHLRVVLERVHRQVLAVA